MGWDATAALIQRLLRWLAIGSSLVVLLSWSLFAIDQTRSASNWSVQQIAGRQASTHVDPDPATEHVRAKAHVRVREAIDDANDVLLRPFAATTADSNSEWARRSVPAFLALFVYGFGLGFLSRWACARPRSHHPAARPRTSYR